MAFSPLHVSIFTLYGIWHLYFISRAQPLPTNKLPFFFFTNHAFALALLSITVGKNTCLAQGHVSCWPEIALANWPNCFHWQHCLEWEALWLTYTWRSDYKLCHMCSSWPDKMDWNLQMEHHLVRLWLVPNMKSRVCVYTDRWHICCNWKFSLFI